MKQEAARESPPISRKRATILLALGGYANTAITIVQGLLLIPLYLYFIGPTTYGLWLASGGMLGMMLLMNFGVGTLVTQRVAHAYGQNDLDSVGAYFVSGMFVYLFICLVFGAVGWIVSFSLPGILNVVNEDAEILRQCFLIAVLAMTIAIFNECLRSYGQAMLRPVIPMLGMAAGRIFGIGVTVFMLFDGSGLWSIPVGTLLAESSILVVNVFFVLNLFRKTTGTARLDKKLIRDYLKTSPALLLAKSGNSISQESEPLLITMLINAEMTTAYMIARKAADMVFLMISVLNASILGSFSHLAGEADRVKIKQMVSNLFFLAFVISLIGFSVYVAVNNDFLALWVGADYVFEQELIAVIGIGFFSRALKGMLSQILYSIGDFNVTSLIVFIEALAKIGLALTFFGFLGVAAVPCAMALSGLCALLALGVRIKSLLGMVTKSGYLLRVVSSMLVSGLLIQMVPSQESWLFFIINTTLLVCALLIAVVTINWQICKNYFNEIYNGIPD